MCGAGTAPHANGVFPVGGIDGKMQPRILTVSDGLQVSRRRGDASAA